MQPLFSHVVPSTLAQSFMLAGRAVFTVENTATRNHFTYKISACKDKDTLWFVSVLTGPDNENDYTYLGTIRLHGTAYHYTHGAKSSISADTQSAKAFAWLWAHVGRLPVTVSVRHEGRCGRCGRTLTVPESIESGFGPECIKKAGAA